MLNSRKVYFENLNAIRFIAAFLVIIHHIENPVTNFLGKISYGLYMYHLIAITIGIQVSKYFDYSNFIIYPVTIILAVVFATISYYAFEIKFINKKKKYSPIVSGDQAKDFEEGQQ